MIIFSSTSADQSKGIFSLWTRALREIPKIKSNQATIAHVFLPVQQTLNIWWLSVKPQHLFGFSAQSLGGVFTGTADDILTT